MPQLILTGAVLLLALLLWASLSALKRRRLLEDLPTSKTFGVFIGLVELKGTAETEAPLVSFLAENRCVWYSWTVQEHWSKTVTETYHDKDGRPRTRTRTQSGWTTVASGGESDLFYLKDDLGVVRVNPQKAEIHAKAIFSRQCTSSDPLYYGKGPANGIMHSTGRRSFSEQAISLHQPLYIVGHSRERKDCVAAEIAYHDTAPIFMISTSTEESHRSWGLWKFWIFGILAVLIPTVFGASLAGQMQHPAAIIGIPLGLCGVMLAIWGIGWFWLVYNSLIGLKNRVKMAASNIDVELKRRYDLIPQILGAIEGFQQHEREVHETLALLRNQSGVSAVSGDNVVAKGCAGPLLALAEKYPQLKADDLFMNLQLNLVETEQRIALARHYYNDVIETHNNRRQRFPESLIANLARLKPVPPFIADDFERAAVNVRLAD